MEIDSDRLDEVWSFQNDISDLFQQRVVPEMERLFDQWVGEDEVIHLDQLVVEVAPIDRHFLADEFVRNLLEALNRSLRDCLTGPFPMGAQSESMRHDHTATHDDPSPAITGAVPIRRDRAEADWEVLLYFLQYGRLPWWCPRQDWQSWLPRWQAVIQSGTQGQASLQALLIAHPEARHRLVVQFPERFRHQLIVLLQPTWLRWSNLLSQARKLMHALDLSQDVCRQLETQAWLLLSHELGQEPSPDRSLPTTQWMQRWLTALIQFWQPKLLKPPTPDGRLSSPSDRRAKPGQKGGRHRRNASGSQTKAYRRLQTLITSIAIAERSLWLAALDRVIPHPLASPTPTLPLSHASSVLPNRREEGVSDSSQDKDWEESPGETTELTQRSDLKTQTSPLPQRSDDSQITPEEAATGLFVNQAGLVILHPFLQPYFAEVRLLEGEAFRNPDAQQTAIYLLHYLATRQIDAPEYELVLPKLLCGWPLNDPVTRGQTLPKAALTEAEHLLQTVINYWEALKSTSPDGLREGFLQRQGKLTQLYEGDWRLQVEQQVIDVLLSRLPWGFNVVKLPWMESMIMVEWS